VKKAHIILIVLIAAAMAVIISSFSQFSTYETFASAAEKEGKSFVIIGKLDMDHEMEYNPLEDANRFVFYAKDNNDKTNRVIFSGTKPTDFERSEQLVMTGYMKGDDFICSKIQMKCPSKYENDQIVVGNEQQMN
jgi:cytochrome c-type biogenesis protein CcmE